MKDENRDHFGFALESNSITNPMDHRKRRRNRTTQSCLNCHTSKRRCDRKRPCSRCIQLGMTGLCVYEIDDPSRRDDPSLDETTRLRQRIAELESLVRELRGKPHPKWTETSLNDSDPTEKWHSRAAKGPRRREASPQCPQLSADSRDIHRLDVTGTTDTLLSPSIKTEVGEKPLLSPSLSASPNHTYYRFEEPSQSLASTHLTAQGLSQAIRYPGTHDYNGCDDRRFVHGSPQSPYEEYIDPRQSYDSSNIPSTHSNPVPHHSSSSPTTVATMYSHSQHRHSEMTQGGVRYRYQENGDYADHASSCSCRTAAVQPYVALADTLQETMSVLDGFAHGPSSSCRLYKQMVLLDGLIRTNHSDFDSTSYDSSLSTTPTEPELLTPASTNVMPFHHHSGSNTRFSSSPSSSTNSVLSASHVGVNVNGVTMNGGASSPSSASWTATAAMNNPSFLIGGANVSYPY